MLHLYLLTNLPREQHAQLNAALAGPDQVQPRSEEVAKILPPPPRWSKVPAAAMERLARLRAMQAATAG